MRTLPSLPLSTISSRSTSGLTPAERAEDGIVPLEEAAALVERFEELSSALPRDAQTILELETAVE
ncbi:hypothetical protein [Halolamina sp.]|uniref:hypothetical protein n=1 Tax=Halolamina sp. TaxID=1940283 RepID=UPI000223B534|nr:hypothetical protein Halar_1050 [halophilic archaeon DL31]